MKIANAVTVVMAAPIPWTSLEMTREMRDGARPPEKEAIVNNTRPTMKIFFCPYTSPTLPISIRNPARLIAYAP